MKGKQGDLLVVKSLRPESAMMNVDEKGWFLVDGRRKIES